ncbi:MAG: TetR/AcrR family transcriptional regulator [Gemmatimonadales bacterium]
MATRESLLNVTARLYAEHGWRGTTTRRIAEAAGVNEVTLFRQFGSKESLLLQAIQQASRGPAAVLLPPVPGAMATELTVWGVAHHRSIAEKSGIIRTCLAEWEERPALAPKACEGGMAAFTDGVRYLNAARQRGLIGPSGSIEGAMIMLVNAVFMDAMTRDVMPGNHPWSPEESIAMFVDLVLRGLGAAEVA